MSEIVSSEEITPVLSKLQEHRKKFYRENIDRIKVSHKHYRDCKKEAICVMKHTYYIENKDSINERQADKVECSCGGKYTRSNKSKHEKSNIHVRSLKINDIINE